MKGLIEVGNLGSNGEIFNVGRSQLFPVANKLSNILREYLTTYVTDVAENLVTSIRG